MPSETAATTKAKRDIAAAAKDAAEVVRVAAEIAKTAVEAANTTTAASAQDLAAIRRAMLGEVVDGVRVSDGLVIDVTALRGEVKVLRRVVTALAVAVPGALVGSNWTAITSLFA